MFRQEFCSVWNQNFACLFKRRRATLYKKKSHRITLKIYCNWKEATAVNQKEWISNEFLVLIADVFFCSNSNAFSVSRMVLCYTEHQTALPITCYVFAWLWNKISDVLSETWFWERKVDTLESKGSISFHHSFEKLSGLFCFLSNFFVGSEHYYSS